MKTPRIRITGTTVLNIVGAIIVVYLVALLTATVKKNYVLGRQAEDLKSQITFLQDQKDELAYSIQYFKTDSFHDREARSKLGLQLPGENVVIIPHSSQSPLPTPDTAKKSSSAKSNLQQWLDFLGGKG